MKEKALADENCSPRRSGSRGRRWRRCCAASTARMMRAKRCRRPRARLPRPWRHASRLWMQPKSAVPLLRGARFLRAARSRRRERRSLRRTQWAEAAALPAMQRALLACARLEELRAGGGGGEGSDGGLRGAMAGLLELPVAGTAQGDAELKSRPSAGGSRGASARSAGALGRSGTARGTRLETRGSARSSRARAFASTRAGSERLSMKSRGISCQPRPTRTRPWRRYRWERRTTLWGFSRMAAWVPT